MKKYLLKTGGIATRRARSAFNCGMSFATVEAVDTVPAASGWVEGTPFGGEFKDGRLYGRGSYDTKCALASHLFALRCLREQGADLRGDVIVESVVDEEYGGSHGVLAARLRGLADRC